MFTFAPIIGYPQNPCNFSYDLSPQLCSRSFALFLASAAAASMLNFIIAAAAPRRVPLRRPFFSPFLCKGNESNGDRRRRVFFRPPICGSGRAKFLSLSLARFRIARLPSSSHAFSRVNSPNYFAQFHSQRKMKQSFGNPPSLHQSPARRDYAQVRTGALCMYRSRRNQKMR